MVKGVIDCLVQACPDLRTIPVFDGLNHQVSKAFFLEDIP